ncbi:uncharacterized protein N7482_002846 [Penicillium canariense]|uniref:Uncharacterized protein n=1 Tax=Penicillium canariense TaxID=189055 RepID=A0A9W9III1_9EURO|nr:uncharacterized protein N7482_002846 [Penicillium canariense]KAJ5176969.1 hypothetical protein N7482_002846 [Penicillium canariense]
MAQLSPTRSRASLPKQLANFTNSTAGLDLTLRLFHSLALIGSGLEFDDTTVMRCSIAASQIGLARRYLRFFGFIGCFQNVSDILATGSSFRNRAAMMDLFESTCLGMYLALEGTTMVSLPVSYRSQSKHSVNRAGQLHDMNIFLVPWYTPILLESYKFWFYAMCVAIARTVSVLLFGPVVPSTPKGSIDEKKDHTSSDYPSSTLVPVTSSLLTRLVIDSLDLTIPGSLLGWFPVSDMGVAFTMLASTILVWPTAWAKAQP